MHTLVKRGTWLGCLLLITVLVACSGTAEAETCNPGETVEDCAQRVCSCPNTCDFACLENTSCSTTCNETHLNQVGENDYECHCEETICRIGGKVPCDDSNGGDDSGGDDSGGGGGLPSYEELLRGWVWQSSTVWDGEARRAVDGNQDGNYWAGSVTHTDINVRPEWHIYTNRTLYKSVTIYNRTDCCGERLGGASVWVRHSDEKSGTYIWRHMATIGKKGKNPGPKIHVSFYGKLPNHYADALAITLPVGSNVPLSLAEVRLWGCGGPGHRCWE